MPAPPKYNKTVKLHARVEPELYDHLKALSAKLGINSAELQRRILWSYIDTLNAGFEFKKGQQQKNCS